MAAIRSPHDDLPLRRVNFSDANHSYNAAMHPQPVRNYSNPAASKPSYDMNDFLRRNGPNPYETQQFEDGRKGSKLIKRQKSGAGRTFRNRLFGGFRSKKSSQDTTNALAEEKISNSGVKYMEIKPKQGPAETDTSNFYDSAWTTAFTTARPSTELVDEPEDQLPPRSTEADPLPPALSPPSSRYSLRLSNDHMHEMIGELQGDQSISSPRNPAPVRHISQFYKPKAPEAPPPPDPRSNLQQPKRESLRLSKSNEELSSLVNPKMTLNAELEALRSMKRNDTPDLVGASGATDPRLALFSHPTISHSRPAPALPPVDSRASYMRGSVSSLSTQATQHPLRRTQTHPDLEALSAASAVSAVSSMGHVHLLRNQATVPPPPPPLDTNPTMSASRIAASRPEDASPSSIKTGAPFYYSGSETSSNATERFSNHGFKSRNPPDLPRGRLGPVEDASADPAFGALANKDLSFWEGPRQTTQTERASERATKVRERKLRDRKLSNGGTPPLSSARGSLEEMIERPSSSSARYPKDAATKKTSPTTYEAPPMPAVPPAGLFSDQASRTGSSRANSVHSAGGDPTSPSTAPKEPTLSQRQRSPLPPGPPPKRPSPPPPLRTTSFRSTPVSAPSTAPVHSGSSDDTALTASRVMTVASTPPSERAPRSPGLLSPTAPSLSPNRASKRLSRMDSRARIAELERKNALLEAALSAVLATAGRLNGCPCQGTGAPTSTADALDMYRATRDPSRLSLHSATGG